MNSKIVFLLLAIVLFAGIVSSLGVTPGRTTLEYNPGETKDIKFSVLNSENRNMDLEIKKAGELKEYIELKKEEISMTSEEGSKDTSYKIKIPDDMDPGLHEGKVIIKRKKDSHEVSDGAKIGTALAVVTQVRFYVPYPGNYLEASLSIESSEDKTVFHIPVENKGKNHLKGVRAKVRVFDGEEKVTEFSTDSIDIAKEERKEIVSDLKENLSKGRYTAKVSVLYGEKSVELESPFMIGSKTLDLKGLEVNDFSLGEVAKINMKLKNKWSEIIKDVYAETNVYEKDNLIASFKSPTHDIPGLEERNFVLYWDTKNVDKGVYNTDVLLNYEKRIQKESLRLNVTENDIRPVGTGYAVSGEDTEDDSSLIFILGLVIGVLVLVNIFWFLVLRRKLRKKKKKQSLKNNKF